MGMFDYMDSELCTSIIHYCPKCGYVLTNKQEFQTKHFDNILSMITKRYIEDNRISMFDFHFVCDNCNKYVGVQVNALNRTYIDSINKKRCTFYNEDLVFNYIKYGASSVEELYEDALNTLNAESCEKPNILKYDIPRLEGLLKRELDDKEKQLINEINKYCYIVLK